MLRTDGPFLKDQHGRVVLLRGCNLSGSTKVPVTPPGATHLAASLDEPRAVSFVGRPFPLEEADEHFRRLRRWGLTFLRFLITWEAVEHEGPGRYDRAYLEYLRAVVAKAGEHGLSLFIDPHQDVWSRATGGDGAPTWTLEAVGMDPAQLVPTGAAVVHALSYPPSQGPLPAMIWPTNYTKLGAATMFTLFFAGSTFAPAARIDGEPAQEFLQRHYVAALCEVAQALRGLPCVVGYGSMNEPSYGFIGAQDLAAVPAGMVRKGPCPTPLQAMLLAAGYTQEVEDWEMSPSFIGTRGRVALNPGGARLWRPGCPDLWREAGVWTDEGGAPRLLRPQHFSHVDGRAVEPSRDFLRPFCGRVLSALRQVDADALLFFEGPPVPVGTAPPWDPARGDDPRVVHAGHWYDGLTLMNKAYNPEFTLDLTTFMPVFGRDEVRGSFASQLGRIKRELPNVPFLLGEFGVPFDLDGGRSYRDGDFSAQTQALDAYFGALDANLIGGTLWNYTPDNDPEHGDQWNGEDLSIFCPVQQGTPPGGAAGLDAGGRGLDAVVRPLARATAGEPLVMHFDLASRTFTFTFRHDPAVQAPTEIFVPVHHYGNGSSVEISDGTFTIDVEAQLLRWAHDPAVPEHTLTLRPPGC